MSAAVIITICEGTVDYTSVGDVKIVFVDFDRHDRNRSFPDDVDRDIQQLQGVQLPWTADLIKRLNVVRTDIIDHIRSEPPPVGES